jgi:hypothetical protein
MAAVEPKSIAKIATNAVSNHDLPLRRQKSDHASWFGLGGSALARNAWRKVVKAIDCDDASDLPSLIERCNAVQKVNLHAETEPHDSGSNADKHVVEKIYVLLQHIFEHDGSSIRDAVLVVSASFNRVAVVGAMLGDKAVSVRGKTRALDAACTNGHLEVATVIACLNDGQVSPTLDQSLALRYYCLAGDTEHVREILASDSPDVTIKAALLDACKNGRCDIVALLAADPRYKPLVGDVEAFRLACENGHVEVVSMFLFDLNVPLRMKEHTLGYMLHETATAGHCDVIALLVQDPRINRGLDKLFALRHYCRAGDVRRVKVALEDQSLGGCLPAIILALASANGHAAIVQLLLADPRVDPCARANLALQFASEYGRESVVKILLADPRVDPAAEDNIAIREASANGHINIVKLLLAYSNVDPAAYGNHAIRHASRRGHTAIVKLLLADLRVDPAADFHYAIRYASSNGRAHVVQLLLADPRVDPAAATESSAPIVLACHNGLRAIVKSLEVDPSVDPQADENYQVRSARSVGKYGVVKLLLADPRVNPAVENNDAIRSASAGGYPYIVKLLLADPRVDPSTCANEAIRNACWYGHLRVVKQLMADPRVDPGASDNDAIQHASENGHVGIVKMLLADPRVNPAPNRNYAIRRASSNGHASVVKLLMTDPRVDPGADNNEAIREAIANGHARVVELLLTDWRVGWSMGNPTVLERARLGHPKVVVTKAALIAADERHHGDIIRLLIDEQPRVLHGLFEDATPCISNGALEYELRQREKASALTFLLAVERLERAVRASDVLREVMVEYACFELIESTADNNGGTASDSSASS